MNRRCFLKNAGLMTAAFVSGAFPEIAHSKQVASQKNQRPNILFVFCDDLGWGDLSCYGNREIKTPNIDRIAAHGLRLTNFYVNSPVCAPSRTAIMTGQFPARHRIHNALGSTTEFNKLYQQADFVDPKHHTICRLFQQAGYKVGHFGKWHMGSTKDSPAPEAYGIDESATHCSNGKQWKRKDEPQDKFTERLMDLTIDFIERHKDQPFYVNCWLSDPHSILAPNEDQTAEYDNIAVPKWARGKFTSPIQIYYSVVTEIDKHVGRLMTKLEQLGISKNTIVIFSSDNGPSPVWGIDTIHSGAGVTGPMRGLKSDIYEGGVRVPFIIKWPGKTPENVVDDKSIAAGVDLLPTFCSLAGIKVPDDYHGDGEDMSTVIYGNPRTRSKPLMWEYRDGCWGRDIQDSPALAIRDGKWKLMMNPDGSRLVVYDLEANPCEVDSVADTHPDVVKKLSKKLMDWHKSLPDYKTMPKSAGSFTYPWPKTGDL